MKHGKKLSCWILFPYVVYNMHLAVVCYGFVKLEVKDRNLAGKKPGNAIEIFINWIFEKWLCFLKRL